MPAGWLEEVDLWRELEPRPLSRPRLHFLPSLSPLNSSFRDPAPQAPEHAPDVTYTAVL